MRNRTCRFCHTPLVDSLVNLGMSPLSNSYLSQEQLQNREFFYPLHAYVCSCCFLVQLEEFESPDSIFSEYAYFSSYSETWLNHAKKYTDMACKRFSLNSQSLVVEIASNDGYLLQYFLDKGISVRGIEPAANVAVESRKKGIPTTIDFFGKQLAKSMSANGIQADLLLGNNVLAHVPDINDFVEGMKILLGQTGIITMEFPHILNLIKDKQFDTIYHEHFSYLSFGTVQEIFHKHKLRIFDVEELSTHGGSLRIFACHQELDEPIETERIRIMLDREETAGLRSLAMYRSFELKAKNVKFELLKALIDLKKNGKTIVGYGAPAKGNTLLNYCGIRTDILDYTVDRNPHKQGKYLPGTHIPIFSPEKIQETKPDYVLILPWNLKDEIMDQISYIRDWGGKFIIAIPAFEVM